MAKKRKHGGGTERPPLAPTSGSFADMFSRAQDERDEAPVMASRPPERIASPFKDALAPLKKQLVEEAKKKPEKPAPAAVKPVLRSKQPEPRRPSKREETESEEADALSMAMQGVKPLGAGRSGRVGATTRRVESRTAMVAPFGRSAEQEARARLDDLVAQDVSFRIESEGEHVRAARVGAPPRVVRDLYRRTHASETLDLHGMHQPAAREAVIRFVRGSHKRGLTVISIVHGKGQHSEGGQGVLREVALAALTDSAASQFVYAFCTAPEALGGSGALLLELKH